MPRPQWNIHIVNFRYQTGRESVLSEPWNNTGVSGYFLAVNYGGWTSICLGIMTSPPQGILINQLKAEIMSSQHVICKKLKFYFAKIWENCDCDCHSQKTISRPYHPSTTFFLLEWESQFLRRHTYEPSWIHKGTLGFHSNLQILDPKKRINWNDMTNVGILLPICSTKFHTKHYHPNYILDTSLTIVNVHPPFSGDLLPAQKNSPFGWRKGFRASVFRGQASDRQSVFERTDLDRTWGALRGFLKSEGSF